MDQGCLLHPTFFEFATVRQRIAKRFAHKVVLGPFLKSEVSDGFGDTPHGADPFDSFIGILGLIEILEKPYESAAPPDPIIRSVEGWILGMRH